MCSSAGSGALPPLGFPIRTSMTITLACSLSWLFAACHVLLRLLVPRHPPCALSSLIVFFPCLDSSKPFSQSEIVVSRSISSRFVTFTATPLDFFLTFFSFLSLSCLLDVVFKGQSEGSLKTLQNCTGQTRNISRSFAFFSASSSEAFSFKP